MWGLGCSRDRFALLPLSYRANSESQATTQQGTQGDTVGITYLGGDAFDIVRAGLQHMHGPLNPQILEIGQR